jgi:hypothetical protein
MDYYFKLMEAEETIKLLRMSLTQQQNAIRAALIAYDEDDYDEVKELLRSVLPDEESCWVTEPTTVTVDKAY